MLPSFSVLPSLAWKLAQSLLLGRKNSAPPPLHPFFPGLDAVFIAIFGTSRVQSVTFYPNIDFFSQGLTLIHFLNTKARSFLKDKAKKISEFCLQDFCTSIWRPPKRYFLSPHFQLSTLNSGKILRLHVYRFHFLSFHGVWHGSTAWKLMDHNEPLEVLWCGGHNYVK